MYGRETPATLQKIPADVYTWPVGERIRWARKTARLSHDRLVERLGRSNRSHLIKIEQGTHRPRQELRDALADALAVPRELFADDLEEAAPPGVRGLQALRGRVAAGPDFVTRDEGCNR